MVERWALRGLPPDVLTRKPCAGLGRLGNFLATDPPLGLTVLKPFDVLFIEAQKELQRTYRSSLVTSAFLVSGLVISIGLTIAYVHTYPSFVSTDGKGNSIPEADICFISFPALISLFISSLNLGSFNHAKSSMINLLSNFPQTPQQLLETIEGDPTILDRFITNFEQEGNAEIKKWEAALVKTKEAQTRTLSDEGTTNEGTDVRVQKLGELVERLEGKITAAKALQSQLLARMRTEAGILHAQRAIADASIRVPDNEASLGAVLTDLVAYDSAMDELRELTGNG